MDQKIIERFSNLLGNEKVRINEPMNRLTTFRIGGPADYFLLPSSSEEVKGILEICKEESLQYFILGNGSNLLVSDRGYKGVIIQMDRNMEQITVEGTEIRAAAGALLSSIAVAARRASLAGFEFAGGIPGTLGGAVVMNAGAYGGEMKDIIEKVYVLDENGAQLELDRDALDLGYRHSCIPEKKYIVTKVVLELVPRNEAEIRSEMKELNEKRAEKQPLQYPSAGSTFKRPEGYFAGKLIMDAGLRGYQVGGAQVSEKHCGFVINKGDATAADICQLMQDVADKVQAQFGVVLEPEVKMIGEF